MRNNLFYEMFRSFIAQKWNTNILNTVFLRNTVIRGEYVRYIPEMVEPREKQILYKIKSNMKLIYVYNCNVFSTLLML